MPTLFATDRSDRVTYIAQGWKVTDPGALADIGPVPEHETLIEIPEDVLRMYVRRWLFDSRLLLRMHFDDHDAFPGGEVIQDAAEIVQHNYWRDAAWQHAIRRDDFATQQHLDRR